jgi:hypothetical protein
MVTVQPDRAPYPVITILAKRAFDLNVDIPEATGKINDEVLSVDIRKRSIRGELPASTEQRVSSHQRFGDRAPELIVLVPCLWRCHFPGHQA